MQRNELMENDYRIYGASGHSKVIIEILENSGKNILELYDDDAGKNKLFDYIIRHDKDVFGIKEGRWIIGIGDNKIRKTITEKHSLEFGLAIDKSAAISRRTHIGEGTVIMPGVSINSSTRIGNHAIINTNASIDHDCIAANFVHLSPNATLCGGVSVGEGTHIGAGAVVIPGVKIGKWCVIGAGSVIIKDVPDNATVVGNPGRIIKL